MSLVSMFFPTLAFLSSSASTDDSLALTRDFLFFKLLSGLFRYTDHFFS